MEETVRERHGNALTQQIASTSILDSGKALSRTGTSLQKMFGRISKKIQKILDVDMDVTCAVTRSKSTAESTTERATPNSHRP